MNKGCTISYAVTACNEHRELSFLLELLRNNISQEDEIVVQLDSNATQEVRDIAKDYIEYPLNKDFASFKNNLSKHCTKDYIFQIDADEYPHPQLIANLAQLVEYNQSVDVFLVPRINTVSGLTQDHIKQWNWRMDGDRVNFPDYQWRIWKNNNNIKWINKVHEKLDGFKEFSLLPQSEEYCLFHPKDIKRQEKQNQFYNTI
jgi:glycosyltransferase involved in cell wall biosynthesis